MGGRRTAALPGPDRRSIGRGGRAASPGVAVRRCGGGGPARPHLPTPPHARRPAGPAARRGGRAGVGRARPVPTDHDARWSRVRLLAGAGLPQAPGLAAAPPDVLGIAAWLVPELADHSPARAPSDSADVAAAIAAVFDAVIAE